MNQHVTDLPKPAVVKRPKLRQFTHDFETYCELDITKVGSDAYSRHPSCDVLLLAYAFDHDDPVQQWSPYDGEIMPSEVEDAMLDDRVIKTCWNKTFEWSIWANALGIETPHRVWRDTMVSALTMALPGKLEKAQEVVRVTDDNRKLNTGRVLINTFSKPRKPTPRKPWARNMPWHEPARWEDFKLYNVKDVEAEREIARRLRSFDMGEEEWETWAIDQEINQRGIPFNMKAVEGAINLYEHLIGKRLTRMGEITGLANPNSGPQLLPWLQEHGYRFDDLKKGHVQRGLEQAEQELKDSPHSNSLPALVEVLKIRKDTARASPKKFYAIDRALDHESGVLRNTLQFAGAGQTWRWAGRMFQPQNLPRPAKSFEKIVERVVRDIEILPAAEFEAIYGDLIGYDCMEALVSCIRSMAQAPDGKMLYAADLNAIENRVLGWLSGDRKIMRVFELDRDPYIDFATYLWGLPYDDLYREYKELGVGWRRQIAKPGVLGCGYQLSAGKEHLNSKTGEIEATGLLGYARDMGINLTAEQAEHSVKTWRSTFTDAVEFWWEIEKAAKKCVQTGERTRCTYLAFEMNGAFLQMVLPSGRRLSYCRPRLEMKEMPWGGEKLSLTYETLNDKKQWTRDKTHGGKLTENGDQAISRDILARGMRVAHRRGLDIRLSVHDELVGLADEDKAEQHLAILKDSMLDQDDWAKKLPLKVAGFVSKVFKKD